jgi:hypothetical protein
MSAFRRHTRPVGKAAAQRQLPAKPRLRFVQIAPPFGASLALAPQNRHPILRGTRGT